RCYQRMGNALRRERQIEREAFMTAGEFEALLGAEGVPLGPVHELTRLFEAARYGDLRPTEGDERRAIEALGAIVDHCREAAAANRGPR
ncbi:MAG TPA: DUF4129 domain-containing protein, partial [Spirochaetia bacterium]|nr:DUF4129 domain-containing protein [Spirochaetia bacterium]